MVKDFQFKDRYTIEDLLQIIALLRAPGGCPWDAAQTHESIRYNFIEETYEVVEAINKSNPDMLREELGDVLMQILLHCQMESEKNNFEFSDIVNELCQKLVIRHPHVFGGESADSVSTALDKWDAVKMKTKNQNTISEAMRSVPTEFPALMRAEKVQKKAAKANFDFDSLEQTLSVLAGEVEELKQAVQEGTVDQADEELGDVLFSAVNVARFLKVNPEESLTKSTDKFISRYTKLEKLACERGIDPKTSTMTVLDELWEEVKKHP